MSILIKGMELPKPLPKGARGMWIYINSNGTVGKYSRKGQWKKMKATAIEIPPHGRLIDADALLSRIKESRDWIETNLGEAEKPLRIGYLAAYEETLAYIVNAPTIIESEE